MSPESTERRLAAILSADAVGSTALMARSEESGLRAKRRHRQLVQGQVASYRGEFIESKADETLSIFGNALDAVNCALGIEAAAEGEDFKVHIAIHSADVLVDGNEVHGDGVNIAARLLPLSGGGGTRPSLHEIGPRRQSSRAGPRARPASINEYAGSRKGLRDKPALPRSARPVSQGSRVVVFSRLALTGP